MAGKQYFPDFRHNLSCRGITTDRGCLVSHKCGVGTMSHELTQHVETSFIEGERPHCLNDQQMALSVQISDPRCSAQRRQCSIGDVD